jgi:hypothetical protein
MVLTMAAPMTAAAKTGFRSAHSRTDVYLIIGRGARIRRAGL